MGVPAANSDTQLGLQTPTSSPPAQQFQFYTPRSCVGESPVHANDASVSTPAHAHAHAPKSPYFETPQAAAARAIATRPEARFVVEGSEGEKTTAAAAAAATAGAQQQQPQPQYAPTLLEALDAPPPGHLPCGEAGDCTGTAAPAASPAPAGGAAAAPSGASDPSSAPQINQNQNQRDHDTPKKDSQPTPAFLMPWNAELGWELDLDNLTEDAVNRFVDRIKTDPGRLFPLSLVAEIMRRVEFMYAGEGGMGGQGVGLGGGVGSDRITEAGGYSDPSLGGGGGNRNGHGNGGGEYHYLSSDDEDESPLVGGGAGSGGRFGLGGNLFGIGGAVGGGRRGQRGRAGTAGAKSPNADAALVREQQRVARERGLPPNQSNVAIYPRDRSLAHRSPPKGGAGAAANSKEAGAAGDKADTNSGSKAAAQADPKDSEKQAGQHQNGKGSQKDSSSSSGSKEQKDAQGDQKSASKDPSKDKPSGRMVIVGDTHGQLEDLFWIFFKYGRPQPGVNHYFFNGDMVDRGVWGTEILLVLFLLLLSSSSCSCPCSCPCPCSPGWCCRFACCCCFCSCCRRRSNSDSPQDSRRRSSCIRP